MQRSGILRHFLFSIAILLFIHEVHAQVHPLANNNTWHKGKITDKEGTVYNGYIRYNDMTGIIGFCLDTTDMDDHVFLNSKIKSMDYFVASEKRWRAFEKTSFDVIASDEHIETFGEKLLEHKNIVVLAEVKRPELTIRQMGSQTHLEPQTYSGGIPTHPNQMEGFKQFENIYAVDNDGHGVLLLSTTKFTVVKGWKALGKTKTEYHAKNLQTFTGTQWSEVKSYIKKNKLKCKRKEDLLKALQYYATL